LAATRAGTSRCCLEIAPSAPGATTLKTIDYARTITLEIFSRDRDYVLLAKRKVEELLTRHGIALAPAPKGKG
jgi:hypothetical protein